MLLQASNLLSLLGGMGGENGQALGSQALYAWCWSHLLDHLQHML